MRKILITLLIFVSALQGFAQSQKNVSSKLESVTIFRAGGELVHSAKASLYAGNQELTIEGLSASIDLNSLQINCSGGATVMGSEFTTDYLTVKSPSPEVKRLQDSISLCKKDLSKLQVVLETNANLHSLLEENKSIKGEQNGLSVAELMKLMDYYKAKSIELETEKADCDEKVTKIEEKITSLEQQLQQEKNKNDKTSGVLKLRLVLPLSGSYDFRISYYTKNAYWIPFYDLQASAPDKPVKMVCKAKFMQTTGLEWRNIKLALSTATPSNGKVAPIFNAWFLNFIPEYSSAAIGMASGMAVAQNKISYGKLKKTAPSGDAFSRFNASGLDLMVAEEESASPSPIYIMDGQAISAEDFKSIDPNMIQSVDVVKDGATAALYGANSNNGVIMVTLRKDFVSESENQLDIVYNIDLPYDVLGTGTEQSVTIRTLELPATFEYYCAPKLDNTTYLLAGVSDWAKYNLLPGEANITYDGTYSGKSFIDPNSTRDILHLTLGNDKRVVVKREKMQDFSSVKFLGNDKKQVFAYQLTVKNTKNATINMILKDQYPISTDKSIIVDDLKTDGATVNEEVGTLTWEFVLKPGETRTFNISYSVKYPKDKRLNL